MRKKQFIRTFQVQIRYAPGDLGHYRPKHLQEDIKSFYQYDEGYKSVKVKLVTTQRVK